MSDGRVVITGVGQLSAVGIGKQAFYDALRSGQSSIVRGEGQPVAEVEDFDVEEFLDNPKTYLDRSAEFAFAAMSLAIEDAGLDMAELDGSRTGLILGSAGGSLETASVFFEDFLERGPRLVKPLLFPHTYANTPISLLAIDYELNGLHINLSSGAVSTALAILEAYDYIRSGHARVVFAGGYEVLSEVRREQCRLEDRAAGKKVGVPFDRLCGGAVPGEAAGMLVIEAHEHAAARGAVVLAEIGGGSMTSDSSVACDKDGSGAGIAHAMRTAVGTGAGTVPDCVLANANGSAILDRNEARALHEVFGREVPVTCIKSLTGETLGAAGVLQAVAAAGAIEMQYLPCVAGLEEPAQGIDLDLVMTRGREEEVGRALINAVDIGGSIASIVLNAYEERA